MLKRKKQLYILLIICIAGIFGSCYYDYGLETANSDVVATFYDKNYDFGTVSTYYLKDSVVYIASDGTTYNHQYDQNIYSAVKTNLDALGWQLDTISGDTADVVVLLGAASSTTTVYGDYDWYDYWGWYPYWGWYGANSAPKDGPYWYDYGWYYPWYGGGYDYSYTYTSGTILVIITDPSTKNVTTETLPVSWIAACNGLVGESSSGNPVTRINTDIKQAFSQSPYLSE